MKWFSRILKWFSRIFKQRQMTTKEWLDAAPQEAVEWLNSIDTIRFLHDQRNKAFQMPGMYDGAMSQACKELSQSQAHWIGEVIEWRENNQQN